MIRALFADASEIIDGMLDPFGDRARRRAAEARAQAEREQLAAMVALLMALAARQEGRR